MKNNAIIQFLTSLLSVRKGDAYVAPPTISKNRPSDGAFSRTRLKRRGPSTCYGAAKRGDTRTLPSGAVYSVTDRGWVRGT